MAGELTHLEALARLKIYERALRFYADGNNWFFPLEHPRAEQDKGALARRVLANPENPCP